MKKRFFILINGSNDLYDSICESINDLMNNIRRYKDIEFYFFYNIEHIKGSNVFNNNSVIPTISGTGGFIYSNGILKNIDIEDFFIYTTINGHNIRLMNIERFLECYIDEAYSNIVIVSGHGGPFQSFLDMSTNPPYSLNTVSLCKSLSKFKIDLLFLDMCAMNYIEVIYELLNKKNIKNIITYMNLAPYEGIKYTPLLNIIDENNNLDLSINKFISESILPIIAFSQKCLCLLDEVKKTQNVLGRNCIVLKSVDIESSISVLYEKLSDIGYYKKNNNSLPNLNFIKYYLNNSEERSLYTYYTYSTNNVWTYFVTGTVKLNDENKEYSDIAGIQLDKESLKHIIWLHNINLSEKEIDLKLADFINIRNEEDFY